MFALADKYLGGAFGFGTKAIVDKAYEAFKFNYNGGPIDLFGFSRGAAAVRMLAARLSDEGIVVRFVGCFDTVGAFGVPINIGPFPFQEINLFTDMVVHDNVLYASHARAKDDKRSAFVSTPMRDREGITEQWFNGDHWAIGSGEESLEWLTDQYEGVR